MEGSHCGGWRRGGGWSSSHDTFIAQNPTFVDIGSSRGVFRLRAGRTVRFAHTQKSFVTMNVLISIAALALYHAERDTQELACWIDSCHLEIV